MSNVDKEKKFLKIKDSYVILKEKLGFVFYFVKKLFFEGLFFVYKKVFKRRDDKIVLMDKFVGTKTPLTEALPLFLYLRKRGFKNCYYIVNKEHEEYNKIKDIENVVTYDKRFFSKSSFVQLTSKIIVFSFDQPKDYYNHKAFRIFLDHGIPIFKYKIYKNGNYKNLKYDRMVITSSIAKYFMIKAGREENKFLPFGLIRFTNEGWNYLHGKTRPDKEKSILFFPTYRFGNLNETPYIDYLKKCVKIIKKKLREKNLNEKIRFKVCIHSCNIKNKEIDFLKKEEGIVFVDPIDLTKHIVKSDILITDYSSVCFDFFKQKKPVLFFRSGKKEGYSDIDKRNIKSLKESDKYLFNICYNNLKFEELLGFYLDNGFKLEKDKINKTDKFFDCSKNLDTHVDYLRDLFDKL